MLARRHQRAFWATLIVEQVALQVHRRVLKLLKPLVLEQLPHLLLCYVLAVLQQLPLIPIQQYRRRIDSSAPAALLPYDLIQRLHLTRAVFEILHRRRSMAENSLVGEGHLRSDNLMKARIAHLIIHVRLLRQAEYA